MADRDLADVCDLYTLFTQVVDPRKPRGVRHRVASVLTVMVFAVLAGARNFREAGDRVADLPVVLLESARTRRHPVTGILVAPSGSTLRRVVENIDAQAADLLVCQWIADRAARIPPAEAGDQTMTCPGEETSGYVGRVIAMDGKTVRHSGRQGQNVKLFSAMLHDQAIVISQIRVPDGTNEITQVAPLLESIDITGAVITGDAAHTQTATAAYLREQGAHYILTVKGNQPTLLAQTTDIVEMAVDPDEYLEYDRHGNKVTRRHIKTTPVDGIDFPGIAQVFRIRRDVWTLTGDHQSTEIVYGISSLTCQQAGAGAVAGHVRQHWGIENKIHWVRDVVFAEDSHHAYQGQAAHAMALFRNLAIGLIRLAGHTQIKRTLEHIAADRTRILPLLAASHPQQL